MDEIRTTISTLALFMSIFSLWFSHRIWRLSNRPIVTASIETFAASDSAIAYNIIVSNTGNRPATSVSLIVEDEQLDSCLTDWAKSFDENSSTVKAIKRCFNSDNEIPLLLDGKSMKNSFGYTSGGNQSIWEYKSKIETKIKYSDLDEKEYESNVILVVRDSESFADGLWGQSTPN